MGKSCILLNIATLVDFKNPCVTFAITSERIRFATTATATKTIITDITVLKPCQSFSVISVTMFLRKIPPDAPATDATIKQSKTSISCHLYCFKRAFISLGKVALSTFALGPLNLFGPGISFHLPLRLFYFENNILLCKFRCFQATLRACPNRLSCRFPLR